MKNLELLKSFAAKFEVLASTADGQAKFENVQSKLFQMIKVLSSMKSSFEELEVLMEDPVFFAAFEDPEILKFYSQLEKVFGDKDLIKIVEILANFRTGLNRYYPDEETSSQE